MTTTYTHRGSKVKRIGLIGAAVAAVVTMSGCATGYQPAGLTGGFKDVQMDEDTYRVAFAGNGYTSPERAQELMLLRMADITLSHGHGFFVILERNGRIETSSMVIPGVASYSSTRSGRSTSGYAVALPPIAITSNMPRTYGIFRTFAERPEGPGVYNATVLCRTLADAYRATCGQVR